MPPLTVWFLGEFGLEMGKHFDREVWQMVQFSQGVCVPRRFSFSFFTIQFETEGNGQNEAVSHMDRSEVEL